MENENLSRVATEIPNPKPLIYDKFKVIDIEGKRICKGTFEECKEFLENSLKNKYLIQKKVKQWQIVRDI